MLQHKYEKKTGTKKIVVISYPETSIIDEIWLTLEIDDCILKSSQRCFNVCTLVADIITVQI